MFRKNDLSNKQMNLFTKESSWTDYKLKRIKQGWPEIFRSKIMPNIDEEPYKVLYSEEGSRPNTPVNILIGILILKSLLGNSDEEMIDAVLFNEQVQYALGTLDYETQPISKNMISNFRMRIFKEYEETGIDLFENTLKKVNEELLQLNKINRSLERADSLMISSSCKRMSRTELIYKVNELFIKLLAKKNKKIKGKYKYYLDSKNEVEILYKTKESELGGKLTMLLNESKDLYKSYKNDLEINETEEFKNLERLINDQYDEKTGKPREGKKISPTSLQTPYDTEATYRYKYKGNIGYVGNVSEAVDIEQEMCLITSWSVAPNIKTDVEFMKEMIEENKTNEKKTMVVDAAYYSSELKELAEAHNIEIHPTDLTGKKDLKETNITEFIINENNIERCPMQVDATNSKYDENKKIMTAEFEKDLCSFCPQKDKCPIKMLAKKSKVKINVDNLEREKLKALRNTEEYKNISLIRSGIEGIPSLLRRKYGIDKRGSKGLPYLRMTLSTSVLAINIKRTAKYQNKKNKIAVNTATFIKIIIENLKFRKIYI